MQKQRRSFSDTSNFFFVFSAMSNTWQKARRPAKQTQLLPIANEDSELTSSANTSNITKQSVSKRRPLSLVHRNATPKPLQLKQPASRKLTQTLLKVAKESSLDTENEVTKENKPLSPSYPPSFMNSHIPRKRVMPQSLQTLHDIADIKPTTATRYLDSPRGSNRSNVEEKQEQTINLSTMITKVPLSNGVSESSLPSQKSDLHRQEQKEPKNRPSIAAMKKRNSQTAKPIDNDQWTPTNTHSKSEDGAITLTADLVHISQAPASKEHSIEYDETQEVMEPETRFLDSSPTMTARIKSADGSIGSPELAGPTATKDTFSIRSPQELTDTTPHTPEFKAVKHASPALQLKSENEGRNIFRTVVDSESYTVQSTINHSRTDSSPLSEIPTSSTDLLSPDIAYDIHNIYPNPKGYTLPEKLGLLHDTPGATIPLSLDASDFDVVPAFPNPTGKRLLEKLALAAQENEPSNMAKNYSTRYDETVDSASTDDIPSSPIY